MRFWGRGQGKRMTGSYPSSSQGVWHVVQWPRRKQRMQKAQWMDGLGMAARVWQGFCLFLCLEPCHTSASSSGLAGKIYKSAGEPGDSWVISLCFYYCWFPYLEVYFIDLYAMEISAASGGLPSGPASSGSGSTAIRKPLMFCYSFLLFFYLLVPIGFPKGKKKKCIGPKSKKINKNICPWYSFW